jgi:hypothetical protein
VVYEYLLSLDALTTEETVSADAAHGVVTDPSRLIGVEEIAELEGRQSALANESAGEETVTETPEPAGLEVLEAALEVDLDAPTEEVEIEEPSSDEPGSGPRYRPRFRLFRRGASAETAAGAGSTPADELQRVDELQPVGEVQPVDELQPVDDPEPAGDVQPVDCSAPEVATPAPSTESKLPPTLNPAPGVQAASPGWWTGPAAPPGGQPPAARADAPPPPPPAEAAHTPPPPPAEPPAEAPRDTQWKDADDIQFEVAPRDGFHLTDFTDFVAPTDTTAAPAPEVPIPPIPAAEPDVAATRSTRWHIRSSAGQHRETDSALEADELAELLDQDEWEQRRAFDLDPAISDARNDINDRLRRRRCDEAASMVQRLSSEVGGRLVAELALDAGDRCRALGKGNAALSCYIGASRADPVFEAPLLRLADVCLDDRDIDLAVTYLDRVARLHRMRGDTRGALRLYRKIATIAPYRDDILATLMRANSTGQFED